MNKIAACFVMSICFSCNTATNNHQNDTTVQKDASKTIISDTSKTIPKNKIINADQLIIPHKSIGHILIGESQTEAMKQLGKPDFEDAAMGSSLMTWYANHDSSGYQTSIFSSHHFGNKDENIAYIKKILINSPWFKTANGISVGSSKTDIAKLFTLTPIQIATNNKMVDVFSDTTKGISFEINKANNKCVGIIVHAVGQDAASYIDMHEK